MEENTKDALGLLIIGGFCIALFFIISLVGGFIFNSIETEIKNTESEESTLRAMDNIKQAYGDVKGFAIAIGVLAILLIMIGMFLPKETKQEIKRKVLRRENPEDVLKRRYAEGEINSFEYTERMARL